MNKDRYLEDGFNEFLQYLLINRHFSNSTEEGIVKKVIAEGYNALSEKQVFRFINAITPYVTEKCARHEEDIPWNEMLAAKDNGGLCSWCQQLTSHDD